MSIILNSKPMTPVEEKYINQARAFAAEKVAPYAEAWETAHIQDEETLREAIALFSKCVVSKDLGGFGCSKMTIVRIMEEMAKADIGFALALAVHNITTLSIAAIDNAELRDRYLPKMLTGEKIGGLCLTEPEAGSDAAAIQTTAVSREGKWILNGTKAWVTHSEHADVFIVFAQSGNTARDIVGFVLDRETPGLEFVKRYDLIGGHGMNAGEFRLEHCCIEEKQLAFPAGLGFKAAMGSIDVARLGIAAIANGAVWNCLEVADCYLNTRKAFGKALIANQGLQWKMADALTNLESSRMLTFLAAQIMDEGLHATTAVSHSKKYAVKTAYEGATTAMQMLGANGLRRDCPIARQLSGIAVTYDTDGTNDICNVVISRTLINR